MLEEEFSVHMKIMPILDKKRPNLLASSRAKRRKITERLGKAVLKIKDDKVLENCEKEIEKIAEKEMKAIFNNRVSSFRKRWESEF